MEQTHQHPNMLRELMFNRSIVWHAHHSVGEELGNLIGHGVWY